MRDHATKAKKEEITIKLLGKTVVVGPGTVPTSDASTSRTEVSEMSAALKKASRLGIFDTVYETHASS